jgi:hypothetical protein
MKNTALIVEFVFFLLLACSAFALENETCDQPGVSPPCDEATLSEVINYIDQWSIGNASLTDVLSLVFFWADQEKTLQEKYFGAVDDAKTVEESEIYRNLTPIVESNTALTWRRLTAQ